MKSLIESYNEKYPKTSAKMSEKWVIATGEPFVWESLSKVTMSHFADWLCANMAVSSAKTYCAQLKAVINLYGDHLDLAKGWEKCLSVKNDVSEQIYLTDEELLRVVEYEPQTGNEATVQQQFILSCLVGARHGDIVRLTEKNIRDGYICYVSEKTHIKAQVPVSPIVERILKGEFYNRKMRLFDEQNYEHFAYRNQVSDPTYNDILRKICQKVGINEEITLYKRGETTTAPKYTFASSHTGRRTCATLLYLHGCDIYTISRILAHADVNMTAHSYIMVPIRKLSEETMGYFGQFK